MFSIGHRLYWYIYLLHSSFPCDTSGSSSSGSSSSSSSRVMAVNGTKLTPISVDAAVRERSSRGTGSSQKRKVKIDIFGRIFASSPSKATEQDYIYPNSSPTMLVRRPNTVNAALSLSEESRANPASIAKSITH